MVCLEAFIGGRVSRKILKASIKHLGIRIPEEIKGSSQQNIIIAKLSHTNFL
jgi:hypothetical protein